jgi:hypothetical protein
METVSEKEAKLIKEKKASLFKGTIAVAVIYGVLALGLLIVASLNNSIKASLSTSLMPFLMTMILGIIVVITILLVLLFSYQPKVTKDPVFQPYDCPDYWTANKFTKQQQADPKKRVQCVPPPPNRGLPVPAANSSTLVNSRPAEKLLSDNMTSLGYNAGNTIPCNRLYPLLFADADKRNNPSDVNANAVRCAYAKKCGISWSAVCPNPNIVA